MTTTTDTYTASTGTTILVRTIEQIRDDLGQMPEDEEILAVEEIIARDDVYLASATEGITSRRWTFGVNLPTNRNGLRGTLGVTVMLQHGDGVHVSPQTTTLTADEFTAYAQGLAAIAEYVETVILEGADS